MKPGETLLNFDFGQHLWVILSDAFEGELAVASFSTLLPTSDHTCVIRPGEHPFVTHDTFVLYRRARMTPVSPLIAAREQGHLQQHEPLSQELLLRVQQGAMDSRFTERPVQEAVRRTLEASPNT